MSNQTYAQKIRFCREACSLPQSVLSELAGISCRSLQRLEAGEHLPDIPTMNAIVQALRTVHVKLSPLQNSDIEAKVYAILDRPFLGPYELGGNSTGPNR